MTLSLLTCRHCKASAESGEWKLAGKVIGKSRPSAVGQCNKRLASPPRWLLALGLVRQLSPGVPNHLCDPLIGVRMQVTLSEFLNRLFSDGRVRVSRPAKISDAELRTADETLSEFEQEYRRELPDAPPPICLPAARWAAAMFYRACQFVAFRDSGEEIMAQTMALACPCGDPPSVHYSVDLTFRYLPSLVKMARSAAPSDPLLTYLARWTVEWPLSSVGMAVAGAIEIGPWTSDRCLMGLYVDRVIARGDASRLTDPQVREAVRQALGPFSELAPKMAAAIANGTTP